MQTFYPADSIRLAKMEPEEVSKFETWLTELEGIVKEYGDKHLDGDPPYGLPLAKSTGIDCWLEMYIDGMSPAEAFEADRECWDCE